MKTTLLLMPIMALLACLMPVSTAQADSRTVDVLPFTKIKVSTGLRVVYVEGPLKPVAITATPNHINNITVENDGETLVISYWKSDHGVQIKNSDVKIIVTAPKVRSFVASSGARITVEKDLDRNSGTISAKGSSGGTIKFKNIKAATINFSTSSGADIYAGYINLSSTGNINASSGADITIDAIDLTTANIKTTSGSNVKIKSLKAQALNIQSTSASDVTINYVKTPIANVDASGSSKVVLLGNIKNKIFEAHYSAHIQYDDAD